jgi:hypothetical protein
MAAMSTFTRRVVRAIALDGRVYEEVEADRQAIHQAVAVVALASVAGGIGSIGSGAADTLLTLITGALASLVGWLAWATLTYLIGTGVLPEPQTRADVGELLRTLAFAASPGLLRVCGAIPVVGELLYWLASVWMLLAMFVAVRHALDYRSTFRAVAVCVIGWLLSLAIAAAIGIAFERTVS